MAFEAYTDDLGNAMKYAYHFDSVGSKAQETMPRLQAQFDLTLSGMGTSTFGGDEEFDTNSEIEFLVNQEKQCHIYVNDIPRRIRFVSDLPGNDRVLRYTDAQQLSSFEKKVIRKFTTFVRRTRISWSGPFSCVRVCSVPFIGDDYQCHIIADRPVPLCKDRMSSRWKADYLGVFFRDRETGKRLYHFRVGAPESKRTIPDGYIYAGGLTMNDPVWFHYGRDIMESAKHFCLAFLKSREILETHCVDGRKIVNTVVVNLAKIMVHKKMPTREEAWVTVDEADTVMKRMYVPSITATDASGRVDFDLRLDQTYDLEFLCSTHRGLIDNQDGIWALRLDPWLRQLGDLRTCKMLRRACRVASNFAEVASMCGMGRSKSRLVPYLPLLPPDWVNGKDICCFLSRNPVVRPLTRPENQYFTLGSLRMTAFSQAGRRYYNVVGSSKAVLSGNVLHFGEFEAEEPDIELLPDDTIVGGVILG